MLAPAWVRIARLDVPTSRRAQHPRRNVFSLRVDPGQEPPAIGNSASGAQGRAAGPPECNRGTWRGFGLAPLQQLSTEHEPRWLADLADSARHQRGRGARHFQLIPAGTAVCRMGKPFLSFYGHCRLPPSASVSPANWSLASGTALGRRGFKLSRVLPFSQLENNSAATALEFVIEGGRNA
jgi:hypothetical protein